MISEADILVRNYELG